MSQVKLKLSPSRKSSSRVLLVLLPFRFVLRGLDDLMAAGVFGVGDGSMKVRWIPVDRIQDLVE